MAIENVDAGDRVDYGAVSATNVTKMLIMIWVNLDSLDAIENPASVNYVVSQRLTGNFGWEMSTDSDDGAGFTNSMRFIRAWSIQSGLWRSNENVVTTGSLYHLGVYYDGSATTNDPKFYVNGAGHTAFSEIGPPDGVLTDVSGMDLMIGNGVSGGAYVTMNGKWADYRFYDFSSSSWSTAQIDAFVASIYSNKTFRLDAPFPVFRAKGIGASGLQTFDGASLGAGNKIVDDISGLLGTPGDSPVGRADTWLAY